MVEPPFGSPFWRAYEEEIRNTIESLPSVTEAQNGAAKEQQKIRRAGPNHFDARNAAREWRKAITGQ